MKLYRSRRGLLAEQAGRFYTLNASSWDDLVSREHLRDCLERLMVDAKPADAVAPQDLLPPIGSQEVWAAGVTYYRSRDARMEEAKGAGGPSFAGTRRSLKDEGWEGAVGAEGGEEPGEAAEPVGAGGEVEDRGVGG